MRAFSVPAGVIPTAVAWLMVSYAIFTLRLLSSMLCPSSYSHPIVIPYSSSSDPILDFNGNSVYYGHDDLCHFEKESAPISQHDEFDRARV